MITMTYQVNVTIEPLKQTMTYNAAMSLMKLLDKAEKEVYARVNGEWMPIGLIIGAEAKMVLL